MGNGVRRAKVREENILNNVINTSTTDTHTVSGFNFSQFANSLRLLSKIYLPECVCVFDLLSECLCIRVSVCVSGV